MQRIRIFVSSPGDAVNERAIVKWMAEKLNGELGGRLLFDTVLWEEKVYEAHDTFQNLIPDTKGCDIVIGIFRHRLGTHLPASFPPMPPEPPFCGEAYESGTAYEVLSAIMARKAQGRPASFVFRLSKEKHPPMVRVDDDQASQDARRQWQRLEAFFQRYFHNDHDEYISAFHEYADLDAFRDLVGTVLRQWLADNYAVKKEIIWPIDIKGSPFRGLEPFDARYTSVYFGRDRKVGNAVDQLVTAAATSGKLPFLLIVGASGAGKSSLMRAGLAPRLRQPGRVSTVGGWRIATLRLDEDDPFRALARALLFPGDKNTIHFEGDDRALPELGTLGFGSEDVLVEALVSGEPAVDAIRRSLDDIGPKDAKVAGRPDALPLNLLLLLDQFEGLFTNAVESTRRNDFARLLQALCATRRVWAVATLRADQYHRLLAPGPMIALKDAGAHYDLAPPGAAELTEIIEKSADASGLTYETNPHGKRLDEQLLEDAKGDNTLPLLQFALARLFDGRVKVGDEVRLTFAAYAAMQGLDGAINQTADDALAELDEDAIAVLPRVIRRFIVPLSETAAIGQKDVSWTVAPTPMNDLLRDPAAARLIVALIKHRILVASNTREASGEIDKGIAMLSVAHQRVLESWKKAQEALAEVAQLNFLTLREDLDRKTQAWTRFKASAGRVSWRRRAEAAVRSVQELFGVERDEGDTEAGQLLRSPLDIKAAQSLLDHYALELADRNPHIPAFVEASHRRATQRLRRTQVFAAGASLAALLATAATLGTVHFYNNANRNLETAQRNYGAARDTIDHLITDIAEQLGRLSGIRIATVRRALTVIGDAIDTLQNKAGSDPSLDRTRAQMDYDFAKVYQSAGYIGDTAKAAADSYKIRQQLTGFAGTQAPLPDLDAKPSRWWHDLADSLDLDGDMRRGRDPEGARLVYNRALDIRQHFASRAPDDFNWAIGVSMSYVRLGDVAKQRSKDTTAAKDQPPQPATAAAVAEHAALRLEARHDYSHALLTMAAAYRKNSGQPAVLRELSWDINKLGDLSLGEGQPREAFDLYRRGACLRGNLLAAHTDDDLAKRDLAVSLEKIASAKSLLPGEDARDALIEAYMLRDALHADDRSNLNDALARVSTLQQIGSFYAVGPGRDLVKARDALESAQEGLSGILAGTDIADVTGSIAAPRNGAPPAAGTGSAEGAEGGSPAGLLTAISPRNLHDAQDLSQKIDDDLAKLGAQPAPAPEPRAGADGRLNIDAEVSLFRARLGRGEVPRDDCQRLLLLSQKAGRQT